MGFVCVMSQLQLVQLSSPLLGWVSNQQLQMPRVHGIIKLQDSIY